jgi:hypothetical protein
MDTPDPKHFHQLFGRRRARINYQAHDALDYLLMIALTGLVISVCYGSGLLRDLGLALCLVMALSFLVRHGITLAVPVALRRPQDALYMLIYKIRNMKGMYLFGVLTLVLQSTLIWLTPSWPHHADWMRTGALWLFYAHLAFICVYRTASLIDHLRKRALVLEVLSQTSWKGQLNGRSGITLEILHAYCTGLLTHIVLLAPWYAIITHVRFSLLLTPVLVVVNVLTHLHYLRQYNAWFYRDHWLGHNSEMEFLYLHGSHHDAIPSGLIGVSGNGFLEGFMRHTLGHPTPYYDPIVAFLLYTIEVQSDIKNHQYIPGIFPEVQRWFHEVCQHSTHHFARLEPYSVALRSDTKPKVAAPAPGAPQKKGGFEIFPESILNSVQLDEQLTGFVWDSPRYRQYLALFDKYQKK